MTDDMRETFAALAKIEAESKARAVERDRLAAENRKRFTVATMLMEAFAACAPTLKFATQGDATIGKPHPGPWRNWFWMVSPKPGRRW